MSTKRRGARTLALIAAGSMALAACSTGGGDSGDDETTDSGGTQDQTITIAWEQEFGAYNNNTADENATKNTIVLNQVMRGFWFFGSDGTVTPDTEFGTFEQTSEDPLTVKYTFDDKAAWSDGEALDCDDFLLTWAANSGKYVTGEKDAEGNDVQVFSSAGTTGYELMQKPTCADGDKTVEVVYDETFADWQGMFGGAGVIMPAHIVEEQSGVTDLVEAIESDNLDELKKAGEFYNTGWVFNPGELKQDIIPSSGPYLIKSWESGQSLTLEANDKWWGTPANAKTIVIRFISGEQQAQALQNNEVQLISPQPQVDVVKQLEAIGESVKVTGGDRYIYEHLDYNFTGEFKDPDLRKAFALCVPRQTIIDNLIKPVNPNAEIMQSRYTFPFQSDYKDLVSAITDGTYDKVDIAGAKAIVESKGKTGMPVRIGYQTPNPRRTSTVGLIRDSCNQAGFDVQDAGQEDFFGNGLANGNFDVALFAWSGSPLVTGSSSTFTTTGGNNNGKYSNPQVDELMGQLDTTPDVDKQADLVKQIETILWKDLATVPLFVHPGLVSHSSTLEGVVFQPSQSEITWNMQEWNIAS